MDTLLRLAPNDPQALTRVATVTFENGSPGRARELYSDLLSRFESTLPLPEGVGAWITYWDLDRGLERLESSAGRELRDVFLFLAALSPEGEVVLQKDEPEVASLVARARGERPSATFA